MPTYEDIYARMDAKDEPTYRPVTIEELENFDELSLNDFAIDTHYILQPTGHPLSADEIKAAAQRYLNLVIND